MTSSPMARSSTDLINCLTTLKLTSASNRAILTSFNAAFTSASDRRPFPRRFLNTFCSLSDKLSKAMYVLLYSFAMSLEISPILSTRRPSPLF